MKRTENKRERRYEEVIDGRITFEVLEGPDQSEALLEVVAEVLIRAYFREKDLSSSNAKPSSAQDNSEALHLQAETGQDSDASVGARYGRGSAKLFENGRE